MAIRYATVAGNFSDAAIWDGGASIPASGDYVYANGFIVELDADVNIGSGTLSTEICPTTGVGSGNFRYGANRIIVANVKGGTSNCVVYDGTSTFSPTIIGNVSGSSATAVGVTIRLLSTSANTITVVGNVGDFACYFAIASSSGAVARLNVTGNVTTNVGNCCYRGSSSYQVDVQFNCTGIVTGHSYAIFRDTTNATGGFEQVGTHTVIGGVVAESAKSVIYCATAIVTGYIENFGGILAVDASTSFQFTPTYYKIQDADGNDVILYPSTTLENQPAESDVRDGVVYGIGDAYEGTLETGSTPDEFVAALVASDLGLRMAKCAVTEEVLTMLENLE
jgi:hypothetical protein